MKAKIRPVTWLLAAAMLISLLAIPAAAGDSAGFMDVGKDQWYYRWVRAAYEQGLMEGGGDGRFDPEGTMTRGMFITVLGRVAGVDPVLYQRDYFRDASVSDWYGGYVNWAGETGISQGVGGGRFGPERLITRQEMAALISDYLTSRMPSQNAGEAALSELIADADSVADWAADGVRDMALRGLMTGDENRAFHPEATATRAEAAAVFVRLGAYLNGGAELPAVNTWEDWVDPATIYTVPDFENPLITGADIIASAKANGIAGNSSAFQALIKINTEYSGRLSDTEKSGTLLFLFEGCGDSLDPGERLGAMAVVVKNGQIVHINRHSSTIPDSPFDPRRNNGRAMPTLISGIYSFVTVNHRTKSYCAALNVCSDRVLRFHSEDEWYESTSGSINIHRRYKDGLSSEWNNSQGCLLIGLAGTGPEEEYARYAAALGLIDRGDTGDTYYRYKITGKVIVDRSFGQDYLRAVGYREEALRIIG